jgi:catechol 2,3-dioxygenase-like lactoylglutathione lyase family enzyme
MSRVELRYTAFYVQSVPETIAFYAAAFGLKTRYLHPSDGYAELETGATLLSFVSRAFLEEARLLDGIEIAYPASDKPPIGARSPS